MANNSGYQTDYNKTAHENANTAFETINTNKVTIIKEIHEAKLNFDVKHSQREK
jgi:hypothetical protein